MHRDWRPPPEHPVTPIEGNILNAHEVDGALHVAVFLHESVDLALHLLPEGVAIQVGNLQSTHLLRGQIGGENLGGIVFFEQDLTTQ